MSRAGRPPSRLLVVDANIVLNAALGLRSVPPFVFVSARREIVTSVRAREEILGRAGSLGQRAESALSLAHEVLAGVTVTEKRAYADLLAPAAEVLRLAPASRNGSTTDAHILALAWLLDADIWSHGRDFAGTGWPSWSSASLRAALAAP